MTNSSNQENVLPQENMMSIDESEALSSRQYVRSKVDYTPTYQRFVVKKTSYAQQYAHIYVSRLNQLRPVVEKAKPQEIEMEYPTLSKIVDLREATPCTLIGTLFKQMKTKPSVLDAITERSGIAPLSKQNLTSENDVLILEDDSGRVALAGPNIPVQKLSTGIVIGASGQMSNKDGFLVEKWWTSGLAPQAQRPQLEKPQYVALVSGLGLNQSKPFAAQLLMDYLSGKIGNDTEMNDVVSNICRVFVVGNSIRLASNDADFDKDAVNKSKEQKQAALHDQADAIRNIDLLLSQVVSTTYVDIMPGDQDPANVTLPQQPLHPCLFPHSSRYTSFRSVCNPYAATIGGVEFLGTSGQPLESILQSVNGATNIECLEQTLQWRHLAPTAPDTLDCYPSAEADPYVLENTPHVYFAGNQPEYQTKIVKGKEGQECRVICLPIFETTQTFVVLNLQDLSCFTVCLSN